MPNKKGAALKDSAFKIHERLAYAANTLIMQLQWS